MSEPMRGEDVPQEWITAAMGGYSMHGSGLIANIVAAVAPRIAAAERQRILALLDAWRCPCGEDDCTAYDTRDQIEALIGESGA